MTSPAHHLPAIIQGGMGVAVSNWTLANAVSKAGHLGVISGTGLDRVVAYRLQDGDPGGHVRRVLAHFPVPAVAERVLAKWFVEGGVNPPGAYKSTPMITHQPGIESLALLVVASFVEVMLAKEGHSGAVGINLLEKIQTPNVASLYGAMLANVDAVLMGAGIPKEIPGVLDRLAQHDEASISLQVEGALSGESFRISFTPRDLMGDQLPPLRRPAFLAIIASDTLAHSLVRSTNGGVNGFIIEGPTAGGHNAPPRGYKGQLNEIGEPIYGPRDVVDLARVAVLGLPYWLAGGYGRARGLVDAQALGAHGIQVGTAFAFCNESGIDPQLKNQVLDLVRAGKAKVFTDPLASPTGFPFKVVGLPGTMAFDDTYTARKRICNLGYLRQAYRLENGTIGWRCAAEPVQNYINKGGDVADTAGRKCLCNGLMATAGHALAVSAGGREQPILTAGDDVSELKRFLLSETEGYSAQQVIATITSV